jgi:hypothetical protein
VVVLNVSLCERIGRLETCLVLIVGARLAGASVIKAATLLQVLRAKVFKVMSAHTDHQKTTSSKRNSGRKSILTGRDLRTLRRIFFKSHRTTAAQVRGQKN